MAATRAWPAPWVCRFPTEGRKVCTPPAGMQAYGCVCTYPITPLPAVGYFVFLAAFFVRLGADLGFPAAGGAWASWPVSAGNGDSPPAGAVGAGPSACWALSWSSLDRSIALRQRGKPLHARNSPRRPGRMTIGLPHLGHATPAGLGGSNLLGLGAAMISTSTPGAGKNATGYGGGGGGSATTSGGGGTAASTGGSGSSGIIIVEEYT